MKVGTPEISVIIVSFNTCNLLRRCLQTLLKKTGSIQCEVIVVDNASEDESADMVEREFPHVTLIRSETNLGFAAANNLAFEQATGEFIVLLNSDAFLTEQALSQSLQFMHDNPKIGVGGARLIGRDNSWQPSARMFPSLLNHFLTLSGLAYKYPKSKFFGRFDRTWANPNIAAEVDWVPGAYSIIRHDVLKQVHYFDEKFFLYYEEVDLCRRIQQAGYEVWYWPDVVVVHIGGESSKTLSLGMSDSGSQISLWQMRSALIFYRKHYGWLHAWLWLQLEKQWHQIRYWKNIWKKDPDRQEKAHYSSEWIKLLNQAWKNTRGGKNSPPRPW
ncbi:glycosyltransferase family 2 protein [Candidatus Albibeggiatoa sp. nov. NOAA]|uniref:glycosyltransferase family 2 protein n=1 Tax=Candidatus Albibeggiatoa sp. nov. NOAA TaxID=3162724 RepID=UPI0032FD6DBC|nr:glycosyltransferase family 2 protein [Thiotrichaceae bacterium]